MKKKKYRTHERKDERKKTAMPRLIALCITKQINSNKKKKMRKIILTLKKKKNHKIKITSKIIF